MQNKIANCASNVDALIQRLHCLHMCFTNIALNASNTCFGPFATKQDTKYIFFENAFQKAHVCMLRF